MDDHTFDRRAATDWVDIVESESARVREDDIFPLLNAWINEIAPCDILDVGSGQGICSIKIEMDTCNYVGVDPSSFLVDRAKTLYCHANRKFVEGNVYHLPFSPSAFDAAFSISVWHLLSDLDRATSELSRVLRPSGSFLIITANPGAYPAWTGAYRDATSDGRRFEGRVKHPDNSISQDVLYLHTLGEMTDALKAADLQIEAVETFRAVEGSEGPGKFVLIRGTKLPAAEPTWEGRD
jgi:ubiquinone/menaquinone biosynthesis C-methylase UbiE